MRVFPVCSPIYVLFAVLFLSACTDRNAMTIDYLSKNILASYQFDVTNASNETDIAPVNNTIPFEVECSKSILGIEVLDQATQTWKAVSDLDGSSRLNCPDEQKASFALPMSAVGPLVSPTSAGDQRKTIQVRLTVKNLLGETSQYTKNYSAVFAAPAVTIQSAANIGGASGGAAGTTYTVSGTCANNGGSVEVTAPFATTTTATCVSGAYSVDMTLGTFADGTSKVTAKHTPMAPYYAFSQTEKSILIDRVAPTIRIDSPSNGVTLNQSQISGGSLTVSGVCESGLSVSVTIGGSSTLQTTCTSGSFSLGVMATQGGMTFVASQTDSLGNTGTSSTVSVTVDTIAPAGVTGLGILSAAGGTDAIADLTLTDINPMLQYTNVDSSTTLFDVAITSTSGTILCSSAGLAASVGSFSTALTGCSLTNGSSYKMVVRSKDAAQNFVDSIQTFTVSYTVPTISSMTVTNATDGAVMNLASVSAAAYIGFDLTFNRPVTYTGSPVILLNTTGAAGRSVALYATVNSGKTYRFRYYLAANESANRLAFFSNVISGAVFVDSVNGMTADLTIPVASFTQNVRIDTTPPAVPTGVSLGTVQPFYIESPTINFTLPVETDTINSYIVLKDSGGATVTWTSGFGSGAKFTGLSLEKGANYTIDVYSQDSAGNKSTTAVSLPFTSFACPTNFLYVYHATYAPVPFCIAQTEAKGSITNLNFSSGVGNTAPIETVYNAATASGAYSGAYGCKSLSPSTKYDVPTNAEWNSVANIIAERGENWNTGSVGASGSTVNYIPVGATGGGPATLAIDESNLCSPANCATYPYMKRALKLPPIGSTTQTIWDFSGNAYEFVKDPDTTAYGTLNNIVINATGAIKTKYGPSVSITCTGNSSTNSPFCGLGSFNFNCSELSDTVGCSGTQTGVAAFPYVLRGGGIDSALASAFSPQYLNNAGIFAAYRIMGATTSSSFVGFRCVYHP